MCVVKVSLDQDEVMIPIVVAGPWLMMCDHFPFSMAVLGFNGFPGRLLVEDTVSAASLKTLVHGRGLAFDTDLCSFLHHSCPFSITIVLTCSSSMGNAVGGSVHRSSWDGIIVEIFEEKILSNVVLWAVVFGNSEMGKVGWHDVSHLFHLLS